MLVPFRLVSSRLTPASLLLAASVLASLAGGCGSSGQDSSTPPVEQGLAGKGGAAGQSNAGGTNQGLSGTSGHAGTSNSGGSAGQGEAGQGGSSGAGNAGAAGDATGPGGAGGNSAGQGGSEQGGAGQAGEAGAEQGGEAGAGGATGGVGGAAGTGPDFMAKYALNAQYPEGGTYDPVGSAFYVGSLGDGSVHRIDATTGAESVLFSESAPGNWWTLGMDVDIIRRRLWVCAMDDRSPDPRAGFIWIFDLESGERIANHALSGAAADATCTDVVVTKDGSGYVVDREQPLLYKVDPTSGPTVFASDPALTASFVGQNSVVVLPDESALLSLLYLPSGLARIDLKDHSVKEVSIDGTFFDLTPLAGADGMTYADGNIYVAFTSKLVKLTPTFADWSAVTAKAVDVPNGMTDIIRTPGGLYLLNGQSVRFALGTSPDPFALVKFVGNFLSRRAGNRGQGEVKLGHFSGIFSKFSERSPAAQHFDLPWRVMAEDVFRIQGRLLYEGGQPAEGLVVAVVDEDVIKDDLIGFGVTDSRGEFRLSFTKAAFNQEAFETESYPDIYIVVSLRVAGGLAPVLRRSFPGLGFAGTEDLGDIQLGELEVLEKQEPIPGKDKVARRLKLDDETLASTAAEVAPLVESLTGWSRLLDGIKLLISDSLGHTFASILEAADGTSLHHRIQAERMFNSAFALSGIVALFDPFSRAIHVSRRSLERQGLDSLKVILGHELVHVGQFREFPSLIEAHRPGLRTTAAMLRGEEDPHESPTPADTFGLMANIEGYASHIEQDFLRKHYNCATPLLHVSALEIFSAVGSGLYGLLRTSLSGVDWAKDGEQESKQNQYGAGLRAYRALRKDGNPARFDPHLRPQNTAGEELDTALLEEQASWGNLDAIHQLARRLLETDSPEADLPRGIHLLQVAAEAGHGQAQCELGSRYFSGIGVELHYDLFVTWTRKAMQSDVPRAFYNMGLAHFLGTGVPEDHALGFRLFQEALERGYEPARVEVGSCLLRGQGVQADPTRAAAVLEEAAKNGSAEAYFWLGVMSQEGHGVPVNLAHAIEMFRTAAKGGIARAWGQLGAAFEGGQGVNVDLSEALKCYENAAALGDLSAKNMVGVRLLRGNGIPRDPGRGLASLKEAAEAGDLDAMHNLALAQLNQESSFGTLPLEAEEGLRWLTQAAEAGRAGSQIKLGQILLGGKLCPADYPRGAAWIRRGADADIAFAQYLYGLCVLNGLGVPADAVEAKSWFQKAADQGYELAKEELAKQASPEPR